MMKYAINPEKKQVVAYLEGTRNDAINIINRMMLRTGINCTYSSRVMQMANRYSGTVTLRGDDIWDVEVGKKKAKEKCLANYHRGLEKRINKFYFDINLLSDAILSTEHCDESCSGCADCCTRCK